MPTVSESSAALRFLGDDLDPDEITAKLGVLPTTGRAKGASYKTLSGTEQTSRTGMWYRKAPRCRPADLNRQIAVVLEGTTEDTDVWRDLCSRFDAEVYCSVHLQEWNEGLEIGPKLLRMLGERGLKIGFDIYADPES